MQGDFKIRLLSLALTGSPAGTRVELEGVFIMAFEKTMEDMERLAESAKDAIINAVDRVMKVNEKVYTGVHEVRQAADDALELHHVEKDLLQERRQAEEAYQEAVRQMKADVEEERKELKELLKEQEQG